MYSKFELIGYGLNRGVFIGGKPLASLVDPALPSSYNWGYNGSEPENLALALLMNFIDPDEAIKHHKVFCAAVIAQLPPANFQATIYLDRFMEAVTREDDSLPIHTYSFLDIFIEDYRDRDHVFPISKFIDLPSLPFNSAVFEEDSIEYKKIQMLSSRDYKSWEAYCVKNTTRMDINDPKRKISVHIYEAPGGAYVVEDNIGNGVYENNNKIGNYVFE